VKIQPIEGRDLKGLKQEREHQIKRFEIEIERINSRIKEIGETTTKRKTAVCFNQDN